MVNHWKENYSDFELIEFMIEKQREELIRIVKKNQYNFQNKEVIAASIEMDRWLNFFQQSVSNRKSDQKN